MRSTVATPSATTVPGMRLVRAISTPSSGCSRITGVGAMAMSPMFLVSSATSDAQFWSAEPTISGTVIPDNQLRVVDAPLGAGPESITSAGGPGLARSYRCSRPGMRQKLRLATGILAGLRNPLLGRDRQQSAVIEQGHHFEAHIDGLSGASRAAAMDAGRDAALTAFLDQLFVDLQDLGLFAVELRHQAIGKAEIAGADIDSGDALDVENGFHVLDRGFGLHHRNAERFFVCGLLIAAGRTIQPGADRSVAAGAARRIFAIGNKIFRFLFGIDHRADYAIRAAVQHLADDARLIPRHAHHRRYGMGLHCLEALHHGLVVLNAV